MTHTRNPIYGFSLLMSLLPIALAGCSAKPDEGEGSTAARPEVTLTRVVRADIAREITLTGTAAALPNQDVRVSAQAPGRISELNVAEGDRVSVGQVIAKLDSHPYHQQLLQAEAVSQQAKAALDNAKLNLTRNEDLFQRGIVARKDLEDARTQQSVSTAASLQAEAALELARLQLSRTQILSPINGLVAKRFVSVGEQVDGTASQPIVEVANLQEVEFLGNAPAIYLAKIHAGESVDVTTETVPGKKFPGRVAAVSPAIDPATGVGLVRIRVPNSGGLLRLGVFLSAEISTEKHTNALCVPPEAIYRDESGEPRVFTVLNDSAKAVPVELGIETKDLDELLAGVKEGDTVILTGGYGLGDEAKIQIKAQLRQ